MGYVSIMGFFIIIRGPSGAGKSTLAKTLTKLLHCYHISFDTIIQENGLGYIPGEKCVPKAKMLAANKIIIPLAQKKLDRNQIVLFDGNFYHKSQIEDLIKKLRFPHFVFTLKADLIECLARNTLRSNPLDAQAIIDVFKLTSKFDYGISINTNQKNVSEIAHEVVKHLPKR